MLSLDSHSINIITLRTALVCSDSSTRLAESLYPVALFYATSLSSGHEKVGPLYLSLKEATRLSYHTK